MLITNYTKTAEYIRDNRRYTRNFILTDNSGKKSTHRLFVSDYGTIAEFRKRSSTTGYPFPLEGFRSIEAEVTESVEIMRRNTAKMEEYLQASGLWGTFLEPLKRLRDLHEDKAQEILDTFRGDYKKQDELKKEYGLERFDSDLLYNIFHKGTIKTIRQYYPGQTDRIKEIISRKEKFSSAWENGYDCSVEIKNTEEEYKGWYSEEYRGCGNGHYYLLLDHKHAIFYEND